MGVFNTVYSFVGIYLILISYQAPPILSIIICSVTLLFNGGGQFYLCRLELRCPDLDKINPPIHNNSSGGNV